MMKRDLCWPLDDVVFGSMKVSVGKEKPKSFAKSQQDPLFEASRPQPPSLFAVRRAADL